MKEIDINTWNRKKNYEWFITCMDSTLSITSTLDITKLVNLTKERSESFFVNFLYIVVMGLNSREEMKMRLVNNKPVLFDYINPKITVMTKADAFENVRIDKYDNYKDFYVGTRKLIDEVKNEVKLNNEDYNQKDVWDDYYITCTPWLTFTDVKHPMPGDLHSQCVPRICWGKYVEKDGKYEINLNITASHIFVDGYPLCEVFNNIQKYLDDVENILK